MLYAATGGLLVKIILDTSFCEATVKPVTVSEMRKWNK